MEEIMIDYTGNPPEHFFKMFFILIKTIMADIKEEVLANNGRVHLDYNSDHDIQIRAKSTNPETTMKMTIKLQGVMGKLVANN